jgi:hypothetical protein
MVTAILGASDCDIVNNGFGMVAAETGRNRPASRAASIHSIAAGNLWMRRAKTMKRTARAVTWWYGAVASAGFAFGLIGERRPFGEDILAHPLVVYCLAVALALMVLRVAMRRPVPEIIPERALVAGCAVGLVLFLAGNFVATYLVAH